MFTYVRIRRGRWLALVLCILGLAAVARAQIQLRGPPLNQRPPNQVITITDPFTNITTTTVVPQHVQLMPGKPPIPSLDNGSLGNYPISTGTGTTNNFVFAFPPEQNGPTGGFGGGGGLGGFGGGGLGGFGGGGLGGGGLGGFGGGGLGGGGLGGFGGGGLGGFGGGGLGGIGGGGLGGFGGGLGGGGLGGFGGGFGGNIGIRAPGFSGFGGTFAGFGGAAGALGGGF